MFLYCLMFVLVLGSCSGETPAKDLVQYLMKCADDGGINGVIDCGSRRLIRSISKASLIDDIQIIPGLHIVCDEPVKKRIAKEIDEKEDSNINDQGLSKSFKQLENSLSKFVKGRSLKVNFNEAIGEITARDAQVKPKKPSMTGSLMMGLGTTLVTMVPVMMGGLALLSAKALLVSKIALVVSLILFVQYFFSNAKNLFLSSGKVTVAPYPSYPHTIYGAPNSVNGQETLNYARNLKPSIIAS